MVLPAFCMHPTCSSPHHAQAAAQQQVPRRCLGSQILNPENWTLKPVWCSTDTWQESMLQGRSLPPQAPAQPDLLKQAAFSGAPQQGQREQPAGELDLDMLRTLAGAPSAGPNVFLPGRRASAAPPGATGSLAGSEWLSDGEPWHPSPAPGASSAALGTHQDLQLQLQS